MLISTIHRSNQAAKQLMQELYFNCFEINISDMMIKHQSSFEPINIPSQTSVASS